MTAPRTPARRAATIAGSLALAAAVLCSLAPGGTAAAGAAPRARYLLALGDSLAAGYQPTDGNRPPPPDPATGYPDRGYPGGYAADLAAERHLELVDLACPGETTASFTAAPARAACAAAYRGELGASSQLGAATSFLARHRGEVALVTFDLGANDVDHCLSGGTVSGACLDRTASALTSRLGRIVAALRRAVAADDPRARLVAMDYYDPFLGLAYDPGGTFGAVEATLSAAAAAGLNARLDAIYRGAGFDLAGVAAAFHTGAALPLVAYGGKRLPLDVGEICRWTWMCPLPGSRRSQDIHANTAGYRTIAAAFAAALAGTAAR